MSELWILIHDMMFFLVQSWFRSEVHTIGR